MSAYVDVCYPIDGGIHATYRGDNSPADWNVPSKCISPERHAAITQIFPKEKDQKFSLRVNNPVPGNIIAYRSAFGFILAVDHYSVQVFLQDCHDRCA